MRVYRISKARYVTTALSGQGAARTPGRWHSRGTRLAYTADSTSLAMLEMLVHLDKEDVPAGQRLLGFDVPDDAIAELTDIPAGWSDLPYTPAVQRVGDQWIAAGAALALRVPSAVARYDSNILINPAHPRFADVVRASDDDLALDSRLFGQD